MKKSKQVGNIWRKYAFTPFILALTILMGLTDMQSVLNAQNFVKKTFIVGPYSAKRGTGEGGGFIVDAAQDNFNLGGLTYARGRFFGLELDEYTANGMNIAYRLWAFRKVSTYGAIGTFIRAGKNEIINATEAEMDEWISQVEDSIQSVLNDPELNQKVVAWYLGPEEIRPWVVKEMELLRRMYETIKTLDPKERPCFMYHPQHSNADRLVNLGEYMDILSVGVYPNSAGNIHNRLQVVNAVVQMNKANELMDTKKPVIPVLEMFEDTKHPFSPEDAALIPEFVQHDAYAAVANGADGILIWSMGKRSGFKPANYTALYDAYAKFSNETLELGLRDVFLYGKVGDEVTANVTAGEDTINFVWGKFNELYPSLSVRYWKYGGNNGHKNRHRHHGEHGKKEYILVVNSSEEPVAFDLTHSDEFEEEEFIDLLTNTIYEADDDETTISMELPPRGVVILKSYDDDEEDDDGDDDDNDLDKNTSLNQILETPREYSLNNNYPNPFNPTTSISFSIPSDGFVELKVYDVLGNIVGNLVDGYKSAGNYSYSFDASNLSSGMYFYTIKSGSFSETKKMLLMK